MKRKICFLLCMIVVMLLSYTCYAKYIISKNFNLLVVSSPFYFNVSDIESTIEQKNNEANLTLNLNNFISETQYDNFETEYSIGVTSDKYNITVTDSNSGVMSGGTKNTYSINIKFEPKDSTQLTLEEPATITVSALSPYVKEITKNITIKNSDILYNVGVVSGGYSTNIDSTGVAGWSSLTADNFFLDITQLEVPGEAVGTMNFSKSYDSSTGVLTLNRTAIVRSWIYYSIYSKYICIFPTSVCWKCYWRLYSDD